MKIKILTLVMAVLATALCGCNEPTRVSGAEFTAMLKRNPESMRSTQFIGVRDDGMAILKVSEMSLTDKRKWKETFFVTPMTNLPPDFPYPLPVPAPLHDRRHMGTEQSAAPLPPAPQPGPSEGAR